MNRARQCYSDMKQRCLNPNSQQYKNYGARGITICERWLESVDNFLADMGEKPDGMSLDRIDNDGPYAPWNCRWASPREQRRNQRTCANITYRGKTMTRAEWGEELGLHPATIQYRLEAGWSVEEAMTTVRFKNGNARKSAMESAQ